VQKLIRLVGEFSGRSRRPYDEGRHAGLPLHDHDTAFSKARNFCRATAIAPMTGQAGWMLSLYRDSFNQLDFIGGEFEPLGLEIFSHVLLAGGSGQREHADLHGEAEDDLCGSGA
jgi:hypothetical protein